MTEDRAHCSAEGCDSGKPVVAWGMCDRCYRRYKANGGTKPEGWGRLGSRAPTPKVWAGHVTKTCAYTQCLQPFTRTGPGQGPLEFCTQQHMNKARWAAQKGACANCHVAPSVELSLYCDPCRLAHNEERKARMRRLYRARKEGVPSEHYTALEVCERDNWRCMICGRKVNAKRKFPHPLSAVVDHVIPVSRGGPNVLENVQLAHNRCNGIKNARGGGQPSLLSPDVLPTWEPRKESAWRSKLNARNADIKARYIAGASRREIAADLALSKAGVQNATRGMPPPPLDDVTIARDATIRDRYQTGTVSRRELMLEYGMNEYHICQTLRGILLPSDALQRRYELARRLRAGLAETICAEYAAGGVLQSDLALKHNLNLGTVSKMVTAQRTSALSARNVEICGKRSQGASISDLADEYDLSAIRIGEISHDVTPPDPRADRDATIRRLRESGMLLREIAVLHGISGNQVGIICRGLDLPDPNTTRDAAIRTKVASGMTRRAVAAEFGVEAWVVSRIVGVKHRGKTQLPRDAMDARNAEVCAEHAAGKPAHQLARDHDLDPTRIYQIVSNPEKWPAES